MVRCRYIGNRKDSDYENRPIVASTGDRNRFNIIRLTEVVFDSLMNEVDYEHYEVGKQITEHNETARTTANDRPQNVYRAVDTGANLQAAITTSNNQLTVDDVSGLIHLRHRFCIVTPMGLRIVTGCVLRLVN